MKYLLIILFLSGCSFSKQEACEFDNGRRAFLGLPLNECK